MRNYFIHSMEKRFLIYLLLEKVRASQSYLQKKECSRKNRKCKCLEVFQSVGGIVRREYSARIAQKFTEVPVSLSI